MARVVRLVGISDPLAVTAIDEPPPGMPTWAATRRDCGRRCQTRMSTMCDPGLERA
jgi:hypothetical protein